MKSRAPLGTGLLLIALAGAGSQARATPIGIQYNVTLNEGVGGVSNILVYNVTTLSFAETWPYSLSSGSSSFTENYQTTFPPVTGSLVLGLTTNLPGDPLGVTTTHLVVFGDFTPSEIGESFSTLFPDANESALIYDLTNVFVVDASSPALYAARVDDVDPLINDAQGLGLLVPPGGTFDLVAFTNGQLIGTGMSEIVTPEPATQSLMGLILCGVAGALWRRARLSRAFHTSLVPPVPMSAMISDKDRDGRLP
jgi:hypothetical protein